MEFIKLHNAASAIVASGNVTVNCQSIIVYYNTPQEKDKDDKKEQNNEREEQNNEKEEQNNEKEEQNVSNEQSEPTLRITKPEKEIKSNDICHSCKEPIVGLVITALGKKWHQEHWVCYYCKEELHTETSTTFHEVDGKPYCKKDYGILFSFPCAACNETIFGASCTAMGKDWHEDHFVCTHCNMQLMNKEFYVNDDKPYCKEDYFTLFGSKCIECKKPIMEQCITVLDKTWHAECFACWECKVPFLGGSYWKYDNQPYCELHYHEKRGTICASCHYPIEDKYFSAKFRKYHIEHFTCYICNVQLNTNNYKMQNDNLYCHECFEFRSKVYKVNDVWHKKNIVCTQCEIHLTLEVLHTKDGMPYCKDDYFALFGVKCNNCKEPIVENSITALDKQWHPTCFVCKECQIILEESSYKDYENEPYCELHYHAKKGTICASCHYPITGKYYSVSSRKYHPEHYVCYTCSKKIVGDNYMIKYENLYCYRCFELRINLSNVDNIWHQKELLCTHCKKQLTVEEIHIEDEKPYCNEDYRLLFGNRCGGCKQNVTTEHISAIRKKWHLQCFVCKECKMTLDKNTFYTVDDEPYCESHYRAKSGKICSYCNQPINHEYFTAENRNYHPEHYICFICSKHLEDLTFKFKDDNIYCSACFNLF